MFRTPKFRMVSLGESSGLESSISRRPLFHLQAYTVSVHFQQSKHKRMLVRCFVNYSLSLIN